MKKSLLLVEDDNRLRKTLKLEFEERDYEVMEADSLATIPDRIFDYAIVDMRLRGESGLMAMETILKFSPDCRIVVLTGYGSIATAVEATKRGAVNYLTKPVDVETLIKALKGESIEAPDNDQPISLSQKEHEYIEFMLTQHNGNIAQTAKALGLHRQSLQRKLKKRP